MLTAARARRVSRIRAGDYPQVGAQGGGPLAHAYEPDRVRPPRGLGVESLAIVDDLKPHPGRPTQAHVDVPGVPMYRGVHDRLALHSEHRLSDLGDTSMPGSRSNATSIAGPRRRAHRRLTRSCARAARRSPRWQSPEIASRDSSSARAAAAITSVAARLRRAPVHQSSAVGGDVRQFLRQAVVEVSAPAACVPR